MEGFIVLPSLKEAIMILIGLLLAYLAITKKYEPLLLLPIGIGILLVNLPLSPLRETGSFLDLLFQYGVRNEFLPLLIFISIGAMMDFRPLLEKPWLIVFGAIGQIGIFGSMIVALLLGFSLFEAASIGVIGSADGPTSIVVASQLAPQILGTITLAAYSYMALVPLIQPPIMRLLTTKGERLTRMPLGVVKVNDTLIRLFPYLIIILASFLSPMSIPLIGTLMFGNILATSGVTEMLAKTAKETMAGLVTLLLGIAVGSTMQADVFLRADTLLIFALGLLAFALSTAVGVLVAKGMRALGIHVNPLVGAAGLSSFPMSARLVHQLGQAEDKHNYLLMPASSTNVAGQIGSVLAGGVLLDLSLRFGDVSSVAVGVQILLIGMGKVLLALALIGVLIYLFGRLWKRPPVSG
jgi:sodium ion-translocating decarboxylase beta subunit